MGGVGSGRWSGNITTTTEEVPKVDIRYLTRRGWLYPGYAGLLSWSCSSESRGSVQFMVEEHFLYLDYTRRHWFEDEGEKIHQRILTAFEEELERSKQEGYKPPRFDDMDYDV